MPTGNYGWYVLAVLVLAYAVSYIDRTILTLMVDPIRSSLDISEVEISLLHGFAFAILYTFLGIPIARLADRFNRTKIIAGGILVWSLMTAICGLARNFGQMFLARIGVGVGEAALSPAAFSILSDYFPPRRLPLVFSIYSTAVYVGGGIAMIAGGAIIAAVPSIIIPFFGHLEPWRVVFLCVGLPGIAVMGLMLTVREPKRRGLLRTSAPGKSLPFREIARYIMERKGAYGFLICGFSVHSLMLNGVFAWAPTYFMRTFQWDPATVGLRYGFTLMIFGSLGILSGAWVSGWLRRRGRSDANLMIGIISSIVMLPVGIAAPLMPNGGISLAVYSIFIFFASFPYGGAAAASQEITPNQMRAQITALFFFILNLAGIGAGPTIVAMFTEIAFHDDMAIRYSMAAVVACAAPVSALLLWRGLRPYRTSLTMTNW